MIKVGTVTIAVWGERINSNTGQWDPPTSINNWSKVKIEDPLLTQYFESATKQVESLDARQDYRNLSIRVTPVLGAIPITNAADIQLLRELQNPLEARIR